MHAARKGTCKGPFFSAAYVRQQTEHSVMNGDSRNYDGSVPTLARNKANHGSNDSVVYR